MRRLLAGRLLQGLAVLWLVATFTFTLLHLAPGDPYSYQGDRRIAPEILAHWRHVYCLDRPLPAQYGCYLASLARGDLGFSISQSRPVRDILIDYVPRTLELMTLALLLSFAVGIALGVLEARRRGTFADWGSRGIALFFYSMPSFWFALMLILIFSLKASQWGLPQLPATGMTSVGYEFLPAGAKVWDRVQHLILPVIALGIGNAAGVARYMRGSMLEVIHQDYIRTARAKGLAPSRVIFKHALRNALIPIITLLGLYLPILLSGSVLVETIFGWPGMGRLIVDAIFQRDYPLIMAASFVVAAMVVFGNLMADVLYAVVDPRIRNE